MEVNGFIIIYFYLGMGARGSVRLKFTLVAVPEIQVSLIHKQVKEIK